MKLISYACDANGVGLVNFITSSSDIRDLPGHPFLHNFIFGYSRFAWSSFSTSKLPISFTFVWKNNSCMAAKFMVSLLEIQYHYHDQDYLYHDSGLITTMCHLDLKEE